MHSVAMTSTSFEKQLLTCYYISEIEHLLGRLSDSVS